MSSFGAADAASRPDFILADLRQLHEPYPEIERKRGTLHVGRAAVHVDGRRVVIDRDGDDALDLLRAACLAIWESGTAIHALDVPERLYR